MKSARLLILLAAGALGIPAGFLFAHAVRMPAVKSLADYQPAIITRIYDRNGVAFAEYSIQKRIVIPKREMSQNFINAVIAPHCDGLLPEEGGATVKLRGGSDARLSIRYDLRPEHFEAARAAQAEMAKIQFAAGAKQVLTLHEDPVVMESEQDLGKLDGAPWERVRLKLFSAHQMGGCPMGADPAASVVTPELRFRDVDNLFVVDGSIFPTSLGVNPQQTIFALSRWGSQFVAAAAGA
jgi:choline dehydrogenase-like flavoprotein